MNEFLISIIVPVYKAEEYLDRCVESLVNQTYTNLEIILVDDGSPDNSGKLCDEWAKKDKRIKVIHKENGGVSSARNIGIDNANGEYIGFVDSDDYVKKDFIEKMISINNVMKYDVICCNSIDVGEYDREDKTLNIKIDKSGSFSLNKVYDDLFNGKRYIYNIWAKLYKNETIKKYFFENLKYSEDFNFNINLLRDNVKIYLLNYEGYYYFHNKYSVSSTINNDKRNMDELVTFDLLVLTTSNTKYISFSMNKFIEKLYYTIRQMNKTNIKCNKLILKKYIKKVKYYTNCNIKHYLYLKFIYFII